MPEPTTIWTFSRGTDAVQISRVAMPSGRWCLLITGPDAAHRIEECEDLLTAATQQAEEERRLVASGFRLAAVMAGATA